MKLNITMDNEFEEETWTEWCNLCQTTTIKSESNPWGTCQCS